MNVKNHQVKISETCPKEMKGVVLRYWKLDNNTFRNKPTNIAKSLQMTIYQFSQIIRENSALVFDMQCTHCHTFIRHEVYSQTGYISKTAYKQNYVCATCKESIDEADRIKKEVRQREDLKLLRDAIHNKHWEQLNRFEFKVLSDIIFENNFTSIINKNMSTSRKFWAAIYKLKDLLLIVLEYNFHRNSIIDVHYLPELREALPTIELYAEKEAPPTSFDKETNELRFRLTKNPSPHNYDSPEYSGALEFMQTVVLKPGVEYSFAAWKRQNDVLYLTIVPTKNKQMLPKQKKKAW